MSNFLNKMDKSYIKIDKLASKDNEAREYWLSKTPEERFLALENLRRRLYNYDSTRRLQRFFEIVKR